MCRRQQHERKAAQDRKPRAKFLVGCDAASRPTPANVLAVLAESKLRILREDFVN